MRIMICLLGLAALSACAEAKPSPSAAYSNYTGYDCYTDAMRDLDTQMAAKSPFNAPLAAGNSPRK